MQPPCAWHLSFTYADGFSTPMIPGNTIWPSAGIVNMSSEFNESDLLKTTTGKGHVRLAPLRQWQLITYTAFSMRICQLAPGESS